MWELPPFTRQMRIEDALATIASESFQVKKEPRLYSSFRSFYTFLRFFFIISVPILYKPRRGSYHYRGDGTLK